MADSDTSVSGAGDDGGATSSSGAGSTGGSGAGGSVIDLSAFKLAPDAVSNVEQRYTIPSSVRERFPDLIPLILTTESMKEEERDYWFQVLPIMSDEQITKLRGILTNERDQLKKIDTEYEQEMAKLNTTHAREWHAFEEQAKRTALREAEAHSEEAERAAEEALLKKLEGGELASGASSGLPGAPAAPAAPTPSGTPSGTSDAPPTIQPL